MSVGPMENESMSAIFTMLSLAAMNIWIIGGVLTYWYVPIVEEPLLPSWKGTREDIPLLSVLREPWKVRENIPLLPVVRGVTRCPSLTIARRDWPLLM